VPNQKLRRATHEIIHAIIAAFHRPPTNASKKFVMQRVLVNPFIVDFLPNFSSRNVSKIVRA
jgi:hypothetical protein